MTPQTPATPRNNRPHALLQYPLLCAAILLSGCADTSSSFCTRTEQVVQAILAQIPGVDSCEQVTDTHLATITTLDLSGQSITELQAGDFSGLTNLSSLNFSDNPGGSLRFSIFTELPNLSSLNLGDDLIFDKQATSMLPSAPRLPFQEQEGLFALGQILENLPQGSPSEVSVFASPPEKMYVDQIYANPITAEMPEELRAVFERVQKRKEQGWSNRTEENSSDDISLEDREMRDNRLRLVFEQIAQHLQENINNVYDVGVGAGEGLSLSPTSPDPENEQPALNEQEQDEAK